MAEIFKNYMSITSTLGNEKVIVPAGVDGVSNTSQIADDSSYGNNTRTRYSTVQVHSLYITQAFLQQRCNGTARYDEENFRRLDVFIVDTANDNPGRVYIMHDVMLVPGSPYYIEKNITLTPSQKLCYEVPSIAPNSNGDTNINIIASAIEFVDDE